MIYSMLFTFFFLYFIHPLSANQMGWWDTLEYANRMSLRAGLKPAYVLDGMLSGEKIREHDPQNPYSNLDKPKFNSDSGNYYDCEGFRLPTDAEWDFIASARGRIADRWNQEKSEGEREHSSDRRRGFDPEWPFIVDGKPFYDFFGQIKEWVFDDYPVANDSHWDVDPLRFASAHEWQSAMGLARGGYSLTSTEGFIDYEKLSRESRVYRVGIRFVRTIRP